MINSIQLVFFAFLLFISTIFEGFLKLGQKYKNIFVCFLVQTKTAKSPFKINWPLADPLRAHGFSYLPPALSKKQQVDVVSLRPRDAIRTRLPPPSSLPRAPRSVAHFLFGSISSIIVVISRLLVAPSSKKIAAIIGPREGSCCLPPQLFLPCRGLAWPGSPPLWPPPRDTTRRGTIDVSMKLTGLTIY